MKRLLLAAALLTCATARADVVVKDMWGEEPSGLNGAIAVSAGQTYDGWGSHNMALLSNGTVVVWGNTAVMSVTNIPPGLDGVVAVSAGAMHCLALRSNGMIVAWGENFRGQTNVPPGLSGVTAVSAGGYHSMALLSNDTVVAWGYNNYGQTNIPPGLSGVTAISAGDYHNLALLSDGTVVAWGYNADGQTNVPPGLSGVTAVSAGHYHSLALLSNGTVVAWGANWAGQMNVPPGLTGVVAIGAGEYHCVALKSDGSMVAWGGGSYKPILAPVNAIDAGGFSTLILVQTDPVVQPGIYVDQTWMDAPGQTRTRVYGIGTNRLFTIEATESLAPPAWTSAYRRVFNGFGYSSAPVDFVYGYGNPFVRTGSDTTEYGYAFGYNGAWGVFSRLSWEGTTTDSISRIYYRVTSP